jgi:hypothetical protein
MRKMIILTAMVAIAVAAVVWSIAPVAKPKSAGKVENASEPFSPQEIMVKQGKALPAQFWDAF